jgi:hypothetical protein
MELWVLSDRQLTSVADWQAAIGAEGYPLQLDPGVNFQTHSGFLPAHLRGQSTGFECDHFPAEEFIREIQETGIIDVAHDWKYVLAFRWGGDLNALQAVRMAATAYAAAVNGVVLDDQEAKIYSVAEARAGVQKNLNDMPKMEAILRELDRNR